MQLPALQAAAEAAAEMLASISSKNNTASTSPNTLSSAWLSLDKQNQVSQLVSNLGGQAVWRQLDASHLSTLTLPLIVLQSAEFAKENQAVSDTIIMLDDYQSGRWLGKSYPSLNAVSLSLNEITQLEINHALIISKPAKADTRGNYLAPATVKHWFWAEIWRHKAVLLSSTLFSIAINVLTLATTLFTMSVYDRVIPNQAYVTLWSLAAGVTIAVILEQIAKHIRAHALDTMGQQIDIILSQRLFLTAMRRNLEAKQNAVGTTVSMLREFDAVRDFVASATLSLVADLPFVILFLFIISLIAGALVWVPLVAVFLVLAVCLLAQIPLAKLSQESLRESATRLGITVEALENIETLRAHDAEHFMQAKFNRVSQIAAQIGLRMRSLNHHMTSVSALIQQLSTVAVIIWGCYLIGANLLTTGALFAAVILSGRVIAPLHAIGALAMRLQHTRSALKSLNTLMITPENATTQGITKLNWGQSLSMQTVSFSYPSEHATAMPAVLKGITLDIKAGEVIGVLGRVGCGKTTLLKLLAGLYTPASGQVRLDDVALPHIDEHQLRQTLTYVPQEVHLFIGTLRDNLLLGAQGVSDETILNLAQSFALMPLISQHPMGLDMPVAEGGANFSIGQRGLISLVRALLRMPRFLLLDEPSAAMDLPLEQAILITLKQFAAQSGMCLIIVTHRPAVVDIVDRLIVIDHAEIVADGEKSAVLKMLEPITAPVSTKQAQATTAINDTKASQSATATV